MYCRNCGQEISDNAAICPHCGVIANEQYFHPQQQQSQTNVLALVGFILSFFFPIGGLICSIIGFKKAKEMNGNGHGFALAGIIISAVEMAVVILYVFIVIVWFGAIVGAIGGAYY